MRPTLYLTNWSSGALHGPGRKLCAMAAPRRWEHGDGLVQLAAPSPGALRLVQATGDIAGYRRLLMDRWDGLGALLSPLPPTGQATGLHLADGDALRPVRDGDSLLCACARPSSPKRTHPCHLELLAPYLVRAGWDVVLHGQRITLATLTVGWQRFETVPVYADGDRAGEAMLAEDYGWPAAQEAEAEA